MKSFTEWCSQKYGIKEIIEGKANNLIFYHSDFAPENTIIKTFTPEDGSIYEYLRVQLKEKGPRNPITGFISSRKRDAEDFPKSCIYRTAAPLSIRPTNDAKFATEFESKFLKGKKLTSKYIEDSRMEELVFSTDAELLPLLYSEYEQELKQGKEQKPIASNHLHNLVTNINDVLKYYLNNAHILSRDNNNEVDVFYLEACIAYSLSLQIYAEVYREFLSEDEYAAFQHTIEILGRSEQTQNLQTDAHFMQHLIHVIGIEDKHPDNKPAENEEKADIEWGNNPKKQKPYIISNPIQNRAVYKKLESKMDENLRDLLFGNKAATWLGDPNKPKFKMNLFLPDDKNRSETNELTLQGGGMINHSCLTRIIKVGITRNGNISNDPNTINHFDYYHVQLNLGEGSHEAQDDVCTGTYVTKLEPKELNYDNGNILPNKIDPKKNPIGYQVCMETTIQELIKTERELCFYRMPVKGQNGEGSSPKGSPEAEEWVRLNERRKLLEGKSIGNKEITYFSINEDGTERLSTLKNQRNFLQENGSCTILSVKQLVTSILGPHLSSLHSNFLQLYNADQQIHHLELKAQGARMEAKAPVEKKPAIDLRAPAPKDQPKEIPQSSKWTRTPVQDTKYNELVAEHFKIFAHNCTVADVVDSSGRTFKEFIFSDANSAKTFANILRSVECSSKSVIVAPEIVYRSVPRPQWTNSAQQQTLANKDLGGLAPFENVEVFDVKNEHGKTYKAFCFKKSSDAYDFAQDHPHTAIFQQGGYHKVALSIAQANDFQLKALMHQPKTQNNPSVRFFPSAKPSDKPSPEQNPGLKDEGYNFT